MALMKWDPFIDIDRFFNEMPVLPKSGLDFAIDVFEKDGSVIAEMNLPGIDPERINVFVEDNHLRVSGSREESKEEKNKHYYRKEISRGSFERIVSLPSNVQKDKVSAAYKNGQLTITLPKMMETRKGKVKVEIKK